MFVESIIIILFIHCSARKSIWSLKIRARTISKFSLRITLSSTNSGHLKQKLTPAVQQHFSQCIPQKS